MRVNYIKTVVRDSHNVFKRIVNGRNQHIYHERCLEGPRKVSYIARILNQRGMMNLRKGIHFPCSLGSWRFVPATLIAWAFDLS